MDPDPHHFGNLDPHWDPDQHKIKIRIRIRIKVMSWIRNRIRINMQMTSQIVRNMSPFDPDPHQGEKSDPDPHTHQIKEQNPDPHQGNKSDQDLHQRDEDPLHCLKGWTGDEMLRQGWAVHQGPVSDVHLPVQLPQATRDESMYETEHINNAGFSVTDSCTHAGCKHC